MSRAFLYLRVSSAEQVKGYSLDVQEKTCRDYCAREGFVIVGTYRDEGESAKTADRPDLQRMILDATKKGAGIDYVVFYDLSRFTRDTHDHVVLKRVLERSGVRLRAATQTLEDTAEGKFVQSILAATNELDNDLRRRKVTAGMKEALSRGRWVFHAPLGYRHVGKLLELDATTAPLLRWAFEEAASGLTSKDEIRRELGRRGLKIPRETLYRLLRNPFYAGRLVLPAWGIDLEGVHPPLVDLVTFRRAAREVRKRRSYVTGATETFPFRQVTRCTCGRGIAGYFAKGNGGRFPYYRCQPCRLNVPASRLEQRFATLLDSMASSPAKLRYVEAHLRARLAKTEAGKAERLEAANRRLGAERGRLSKLIEAFVYREAVPEVEYRRMRGELEEKIQTLELEAAITLSPSARFEPTWRVARTLLETPLLAWDRLTADRRVQFLRGIFPEGLTLEPPGEFRTPVKSLMLLPLSPVSESDVRSGTPTEADFEPLHAWWAGLEQLPPALTEAWVQ